MADIPGSIRLHLNLTFEIWRQLGRLQIETSQPLDVGQKSFLPSDLHEQRHSPEKISEVDSTVSIAHFLRNQEASER